VFDGTYAFNFWQEKNSFWENQKKEYTQPEYPCSIQRRPKKLSVNVDESRKNGYAVYDYSNLMKTV
jgi:hypothetical protein